jgi:two-component system CheB/CheR fusion protein
VTSINDKEEIDQDLEDLLIFIQDSRGFDFTGYTRSSLARRIRKRMHEAGSTEYIDSSALLSSRSR